MGFDPNSIDLAAAKPPAKPPKGRTTQWCGELVVTIDDQGAASVAVEGTSSSISLSEQQLSDLRWMISKALAWRRGET